MIETEDTYLRKAEESLEGAESEFANGRYNNCANRCYYACYQAAIYALSTPAGGRPRAAEAGRHGYVQAQFVGELINRRKVFPANLRRTLAQNLRLRHQADYEVQPITQTQAERPLRRARTFVAAVEAIGGGTR